MNAHLSRPLINDEASAAEVPATHHAENVTSNNGNPVSPKAIADYMDRLEASRERFSQAIAEFERFAKYPVDKPALGSESLRSGLFGYDEHVVKSSEINALLVNLRQSFVETTAHINLVIAEFERVHDALSIFERDYAARLGELFRFVDTRVQEATNLVEINRSHIDKSHAKHKADIKSMFNEYDMRDNDMLKEWLHEIIPKSKKQLRPRLLYTTLLFVLFIFSLLVLHLRHAL